MAKRASSTLSAGMRARTALCAICCGVVLATPCLAHAATRTYPGIPPCNTTLQACIDGATAGDRIEIATATLVAEDLKIEKSLTLAAAAGVVPHLGGELTPRDARPRQITVQPPSNGATTHVTFSKLTFDADITVTFSGGSGHSFVFEQSTIERHRVDLSAALLEFPGTTPLDFTDNALLSVTTSVPASVQVTDSTFISAGDNVDLHATGAAGTAIHFDVLRNRFIGAECCGGESASTVMFDLQGGAIAANLADNVMHRRTGGSASFAIGLFTPTPAGAFTGNVYITNNTIDDVAEPGNTLETTFDTPPGVRPEGYVAGIFTQGDSLAFLHVYDNVFAHLDEDFSPNAVTALDAQNNDFFDITNPEWQTLATASKQLHVDPLFVALGTDFHLQSSSPLIDAGTSPPLGATQSADVEGHARIVGANVDIGAYEYAPPVPPIDTGAAGEGGVSGAGEGGAPNAGTDTGGHAGASVGGGTSVGGVNAGGGMSAGGAATTGGMSSGGAATSAGGRSAGGAANLGGSMPGNGGEAGSDASGGGSDSGGCSVRAVGSGRSTWLLVGLTAAALWRRRRKALRVRRARLAERLGRRGAE